MSEDSSVHADPVADAITEAVLAPVLTWILDAAAQLQEEKRPRSLLELRAAETAIAAKPPG
ncbi:MAG: hypothetical protein AAF654_12710 [Myxococcota bacterium]